MAFKVTATKKNISQRTVISKEFDAKRKMFAVIKIGYIFVSAIKQITI